MDASFFLNLNLADMVDQLLISISYDLILVWPSLEKCHLQQEHPVVGVRGAA